MGIRSPALVSVVSAMVLVVSLAVAVPAAAYDSRTCNNVAGLTLDYSGSHWTTQRMDTVTNGIESWEDEVERFDGTEGVPVTVTSSGTTEIYWAEIESAGEASCNSTWIKFDVDLLDSFDADPAQLRGLAAHEAGHVIGLHHSGDGDSHDGQEPTMATCLAEFSSQETLAQDDEAAVQGLTDQPGTPSVWWGVTANSSFEEPSYMQYWGQQYVTGVARYSGGVDGTPYFVIFKGNSASSAIYSTTRLMDSQDLGWVKGRANYAKWTGTDTGHVLIVNKYRQVTYQDGETCGSRDFVGGDGDEKEINVVEDVGSFADFYYTKVCYPSSTAWEYCTTSGSDPPDSFDAIDVRIVVYNRMRRQSDLAYTWVRVDRVRELVDYE